MACTRLPCAARAQADCGSLEASSLCRSVWHISLDLLQLVAYGSLLVRQDKASHKADQAVNALKDVGHRAADKVCRGGKVVRTRLGLL